MDTDKKQSTNKSDISMPSISSLLKRNRRLSNDADKLTDKLNSAVFSSSISHDVDNLNKKFDSIISSEEDDMSRRNDVSMSSFLEELVSKDRKNSAYNNGIEQSFSTSQGQLRSLLDERYRNKLVKIADITEITSQLHELREAILITRDAIISSDVVDGKMSRTISFKDSGTKQSNGDDYKSQVELAEQEFKLQDKIKNFIIPKGLEGGSYYTYCVPYDKIFADFTKFKATGGSKAYTESYHEVTAFESANSIISKESKSSTSSKNIGKILFESTSESFQKKFPDADHSKIQTELCNVLKGFSVCNDEVPLPFITEGFESISELYDDSHHTGSAPELNAFCEAHKIDSGVVNTNNNLKDCYIKCIDALHMIPIEIMDKPIGYYWIHDDTLDSTTSATYWSSDELRKETGLADEIASRIIDAFNKDFLKKNSKFRELIMCAVQHYMSKNQKVKFQFIPAEYVVPFKVNVDEHGDGTSIVEPALFNAKLYLLLLLFKMITIVSYSNDTRVHYIRSSGLDKNIVNQVQDAVRTMQKRQVSLTDMFSYTTLVNKVGNGNELFIPTGRSDTRGIETEILQGQDVQLNSELMEMLRNAYISATGVPAVIMNYINEADFAKSVELGNTRFQSRVVSYQLDFAPSITELYKRIMRWTTNIPDDVINSFEFSFQAPKYAGAQTTSDAINNFDTMYQFALSMFLKPSEIDNGEGPTELARIIKKKLASEKLPFLNVDRISDIVAAAKRDSIEKELENDLKPATDDTQSSTIGDESQ